jgi:hypothetical protein
MKAYWDWRYEVTVHNPARKKRGRCQNDKVMGKNVLECNLVCNRYKERQDCVMSGKVRK